MKKIFTYITALIALAACTNDDSLVGLNNNLNPVPDSIPNNNEEENISDIRVQIVDPKGEGDDDASRATIIYNDAKDIMAFKWENSDVIGVFTYPDAGHSQQLKFAQIADAPQNTDHLRVFQTNDGHAQLQVRSQYVSSFPYIESYTGNYENIPVTYLNQRQTEPVDFSNYWNDETDEYYVKSQAKASAHLGKYDYQCTGPTDPTPNLGINFKLNRMGAIVRFWIVIDPQYNYVYDELQLVNRTKMFTTEALMDAAEKTLKPTAQSHVITLGLGNVGVGFDMTVKANDGIKSTTPFYDWYAETYTGYIMAYMMLGPIDLKGTSETTTDPGYVENSFIYLVAHEKEHPDNKHYFKSPGLSKPNLTPNKFYKWTVYPDADTPIEFSEITVEEWREGTIFTNDGKGTETW